MRIGGARIGAVLIEKRSFCHIFACFNLKNSLVFEVEQGDLNTGL
jgi:hypothetical protein